MWEIFRLMLNTDWVLLPAYNIGVAESKGVETI
jgi:hypothetical protein